MRLIGIILILMIVAVVVAIKFLPWWAIVIGFFALLFGGKLFAGRLIESLFKMPFKAKGAVLKGATAEIHSISATAKPVPGNADGESDEDAVAEAGPHDFYLVETTITPAGSDGAFKLWEPCSLELVGPDAKPEDADGEDQPYQMLRLEVMDEGVFKLDEGMKYGGPQRVKFIAGMPKGTKRLKFRYYFELFGELNFPN